MADGQRRGGAASDSLRARYAAVRATSLRLREPLSAEDCQIQTMPDVSPTKWHLAHTTWFFETFVLAALEPAPARFNDDFAYLYNSYYNSVGRMHPRPQRGLLSRPSLDEVLAYRAFVDEQLDRALAAGLPPALAARVELGLHHEQQHQELMLTDIKHVLSCNPLGPAYRPAAAAASAPVQPQGWLEHAGGLVEIGSDTEAFGFDNERPRHKLWLEPHALADRLVTNAEFAAFIEDGGYRESTLWLSDGWAMVQAEQLSAPLYWDLAGQRAFTLAGWQPLHADAPVCHLSYYEADAYARWAGARLPTEGEWEVAAAAQAVAGNFLESGALHPQPGKGQFYGDVWEWTASPYSAYPRYRPLPGAIGEYNGKFMCNQIVLRGGSCVSSAEHLRASYRNFFPPAARWQFSGLRLAKDA